MPDLDHHPDVRRYPIRVTEPFDLAVRYLGTVPGHDMDALSEWGVILEYRDDRHLWMWVEKSNAWCRLGLGSYVVREPDGSGFYPCTDMDFWRTHRLGAKRP